MSSIPELSSVEYLQDYCLRVEFEDGLIREIDFENQLWGPVFEPLHDKQFFARAFVDPVNRTLAWPNDVDLDPVVLHGDAQPDVGEPYKVLAEYRV